jgi:hypothetical protein
MHAVKTLRLRHGRCRWVLTRSLRFNRGPSPHLVVSLQQQQQQQHKAQIITQQHTVMYSARHEYPFNRLLDKARLLHPPLHAQRQFVTVTFWKLQM